MLCQHLRNLHHLTQQSAQQVSQSQSESQADKGAWQAIADALRQGPTLPKIELMSLEVTLLSMENLLSISRITLKVKFPMILKDVYLHSVLEGRNMLLKAVLTFLLARDTVKPGKF